MKSEFDFRWLENWEFESHNRALQVMHWMMSYWSGCVPSPLILCGPKGSGKTLLARKLLKETTGDLTQIYQLNTARDKEEVFDAVARPGVVAIEADAASEGAKIKLAAITNTLYGGRDERYRASLIIVTLDPAFTLKYGHVVYLMDQPKPGTYE